MLCKTKPSEERMCLPCRKAEIAIPRTMSQAKVKEKKKTVWTNTYDFALPSHLARISSSLLDYAESSKLD